jgi:hypothetical protein
MLVESPNDFADVRDLEWIIPKIENINCTEVDRITDEIEKYQPFIISLMLSYKEEYLNNPVYDEIIKNYLIIWEFFKAKGTVRKKTLSSEIFNAKELEVAYFFMALDTLSGKAKDDLEVADLNAFKHKMLIFPLMERIKNNRLFKTLTSKQSAQLILETRTLIECLS